MNTTTVTHPTGSYPIYLAENALAHAGAKLADLGHTGRCAVVTNETVGPLHGSALVASLQSAGFEPTQIELPDGEQFKNLDTVAQLYSQLIEAKLDRNSPVIALGGGVIGDTVGFAAASYLRGVPFVQIPTSLLAMVDASVGGKTGVDVPEGKNLVGAFKQPEMVLIDPNVLNTLSDIEFRSGMAEVIKHGVLSGETLFKAIESNSKKPENQANPHHILSTELLHDAIMVKVEVVQEDPFEKGRRATLNLGHTFAHAFERLANFNMRHGDAVAVGTVCAARLAARLGRCSANTVDRITAVIRQVGFSTQIPDYAPTEMWAAMFTDKKRVGNTVRFILPRAIGDVDIFTDVQAGDVLAILAG
ncbi:3-dehydroquinate synthase [Anaerolineales bacterium HSG25]|nr:3-dehydroquinate synthase [Anaerolineales bacterium HSG25]